MGGGVVPGDTICNITQFKFCLNLHICNDGSPRIGMGDPTTRLGWSVWRPRILIFQKHCEARLEENKNNLKRSWLILKEILNKRRNALPCSRFKMNNKTITSNKSVITNGFNSFFVNVGTNLAKTIPSDPRSPEIYMTRNPCSMVLLPTENNEVISIIKNLKNNSPGWDAVAAKVVKASYSSFIEPLTHILNLSIRNGVVPIEMKLAKVTPLFKTDDPMIFSNYRPVSVLPAFSKILERLMYNRLLSFINKFSLLHPYQFGFRNNHSPELALLYLVDKISNALDNGECVLGLFLDFSKAFDTVNHDILLTKLEYLGIRGIPLEWFKSYLADRRQYVIYNGIKSSCKTITCGVPQGSILGPLLFLLYINDLANVSDVIFSLFFADDSNMFLSGKNPDDLIKLMNTVITKVIEWLRINKLSLNLKKNTFYGVQKKSSKNRTERGCDHWQCENWFCHPNQVPGSHTRSASYFWITCAIHQRKDCKGHWYFVQSKKVSERKLNENTILCFYISIFHLLYYSLGQHFQLSPQASDCATKMCNKDSMWSTEIWPYLPIIPTI